MIIMVMMIQLMNHFNKPVDPYGGHARQKTISFGDDSKKTDPLASREQGRDEAWEKIMDKFPEFNPENSPFTAKMIEFDQIVVRLARQNSKDYPFLNDELPSTITKSLGPAAEDVVRVNGEKNSADRRIEKSERKNRYFSRRKRYNFR